MNMQYCEFADSEVFPGLFCVGVLFFGHILVKVDVKLLSVLFCFFLPPKSYVEVYNLTSDPHQLENIVKKVDPSILQIMNQRLIKLQSCVSDSCRDYKQK